MVSGGWCVQVTGAIPLTVAFDGPAVTAFGLLGSHFAPSHATVGFVEGATDFEGTWEAASVQPGMHRIIL